MTNGDLQNTTQETKDGATQTHEKVGMNRDAPGKVKKCIPYQWHLCYFCQNDGGKS